MNGNAKRERRSLKILAGWMVLAVMISAIIGAAAFINKLRSTPDEPPMSNFPDVQNNSELSSLPSFSDETNIADIPADNDKEEEEQADWRLILVNRTHPIPDDYGEIELTELRNGHAVDSRIYPDLQQMFDDARADGIMPRITSSYRTAKEQQEIMDDKIAEYEAQEYPHDEAVTLAETWVALPGTSEHQLGMAVDISTEDWGAQDATIVWEWFDLNCYKYGFIRRYPEDKIDITGVINEPWHFRYVGYDAAKEIWESGMCLEEYLGES